MRFTQEPSGGTNVIRAYGDGELRVNEARYRGVVIMSGTEIFNEPDVRDLSDAVQIDPARILALGPDVILLGTGAQQIFPPAYFGAQFLQAGIGFEVMDTGAACRTFNVLAAEQRRVVAILLL